MDIIAIVFALVAAAAAVAVVTSIMSSKFPEFTTREKKRKEAAAAPKRDLKEDVLKVGNRLSRILPSTAEDAAEDRDRLAQAGLRMPQETWRGVQILAAAAVGAGGTVLFGLSSSMDVWLKIVLAAASFVGGWWLPNLFLWALTSTRRETIEKELPSTLELLCLSVRAGYSLERGIKLVSTASDGELAKEFRQVDADINLLGMDLARALKRMQGRCGVPAVNSFVGAVIQAQQQGTNITRILTSQAKLARDAQYTRTMEKVKALANKMTPVVILVFIPMIILIVLLPAGVDILSQLSSMSS